MGAGALPLLILLILRLRLEQTNRRVQNELSNAPAAVLENPGTIQSFSLMPLVEFYARGKYDTEAGVSYLIRADSTTLLLDVGANEKKSHPSALMKNMERLGLDPEELDHIVISHLHEDHVGGPGEERQKRFSLSRGRVDLPKIPAWSPVPLSVSPHNPGVRLRQVKGPVCLGPGIALTGPLPASLFILGYTLEHALVFNLEGCGLIIVIGCGHPGLPLILGRAKQMFNRPVYAVIGGIHLPVRGGRMNLGPLNLQNIAGSDRMPWHGIREKDVDKAIGIIAAESPHIVAISPHDSSDWAIEKFKTAFKNRYKPLEVGSGLDLGSVK